MTKKICAITTVGETQIDFVIPAMRMLKENGYEITIICNMSSEFINQYKDEFKLINIPMQRGISFRDFIIMPFRFRKIFKAEHFDIVQYATPNASLYASIGSKLAGVKNRVYCQWGIRYVGASGVMRWILKRLEYLTCINSTHVRPASWKNLEFAVSEKLYPKKKATVIGDGGTVGIDLNEFEIERKSDYKKSVIEQFPILKDKTVFTFIGRLNTDKGIYELLEAFKQLADNNKDVALMLIGNFESNIPEQIQSILSMSCVIKTGYTNEVPKYLSAADVLVHPSYREGFSMVIQQAMALSIPVVTTDIPGPSEVIEDRISGILVNARDVQSLYSAMVWMHTHPDKAEEMGRNGRNRCQRLFTRERMLKLTLEDRNNIVNN
ncbi:MAG: glycosyltransferase family 4 protein [Muribaculum sp.]|nr:glycosyltransferase family 4 protein [Muribaculum sp.]